MIVDVRAHHHPRPYNEALERAGVVRAGGGGMAGHPDTDDEEHIQKRLVGSVAQKVRVHQSEHPRNVVGQF
jgi:hypothetical protein